MGSSPPTRGAPTAPSPDATSGSDHPRLRGEHVLAFAPGGQYRGSSPPTRGAPSSVSRSSFPVGIIPAYAGSTARGPRGAPRPPDHPRLRGEHASRLRMRSAASGSSPPTRGAHDPEQVEDPERRIIPAYAGSTAPTGCPPSCRWDHPRLRGEHCIVKPIHQLIPGSSPPTRGALHSQTDPPAHTRIIPAYAGSTGDPFKRS